MREEVGNCDVAGALYSYVEGCVAYFILYIGIRTVLQEIFESVSMPPILTACYNVKSSFPFVVGVNSIRSDLDIDIYSKLAYQDL